MISKYILIFFFLATCQLSLGNEEIVEDDTNDASDKRIIGGQDARPGQYPFMASLRYWHFDEDNQIYSRTKFCGGSIIAPRWILTAAHCINTKKTERVNNQQFHVALGLTDQATDFAQEIAVRKMFYPQDYVTGHNDIALLFLEKSIFFTPKIQTIHLPPTDYIPHGVADIMGFGQTHPRDGNIGYTWKLKTLMNLRIIPREECEVISGDTVNENYICIGGEGKASCFGDSGSALIQNINGKICIVGVASLSHFICAEKPSKYENVVRHINSFILPTIRQEEPEFNTDTLF